MAKKRVRVFGRRSIAYVLHNLKGHCRKLTVARRPEQQVVEDHRTLRKPGKIVDTHGVHV